MLTISKLLEALTNPTKIKISQNKLAHSVALNTSTSTVNAWINKNVQPNLEAETIYKSIDECRQKWTPYKDDDVFIEKLISFLDIDPSEKDALNVQYNIFKNKYPSDGTCYKMFLLHLIQMALDKAEIKYTIAYDALNPLQPIAGIGIEHVIAVMNDGRVLSTGANNFQQCNTHEWRDIVSVSAGWRSSIGLKSDGTCVATGKNTVGNGELFRWNNLVAVCCGTYHFLGLKRDGTVVAYGLGGDGQCNVSNWKHIKAIAAGTRHSVGLLENGTVIACGSNSEGQCEVSSWRNVVQIDAAGEHTVALTGDGNILLAGDQYIYHYSLWKNVTSIATGLYHIVGLKEDGTILHTGHETGGLDSVCKWWDIKAIFAGFHTTVGVKSDGSIMITNNKNSRIYLDSSSWNIYGKAASQNEENSPFETARKESISILQKIRELGTRLSPSLHKPSLDENGIMLVKEIHRLSKDIWELRDKILQIKPLADFLLYYNAAFLDFYEVFDIKEENLCHVSDTAYKTCLKFLTIIKEILIELRTI